MSAGASVRAEAVRHGWRVLAILSSAEPRKLPIGLSAEGAHSNVRSTPIFSPAGKTAVWTDHFAGRTWYDLRNRYIYYSLSRPDHRPVEIEGVDRECLVSGNE